MPRARRYLETIRDGQWPFAHALIAIVLVSLILPAVPGLAIPMGVVVTGLALRQAILMTGHGPDLPAAAALALASVALGAAVAVSFVGAMMPAVSAIAPYQPPAVRIVRQAETLIIEGPIDFQVLAELQALPSEAITGSRVILNSDGGLVHAGRAIGVFLAGQDVVTRVDEQCFSACTLAFAGGAVRELGPSGRLGFHGYRRDHKLRQPLQDISEAQARDQAFLRSRGVSAAFLDRAYAVPPTDMWTPPRADLLRAGMITR